MKHNSAEQKNRALYPSIQVLGVPQWLSGKESACSAGAAGDVGLIPGSGRSPGGGMATHPRILAWRIPWTEESGGLQSIGSQRVGHDWIDLACTHMSFQLKWDGMKFHCWNIHISRCSYKDSFIFCLSCSSLFLSMVFLSRHFSVLIRAGFEAGDSNLPENVGPNAC